MAKFYGAIGFAVNTETSPGVWKDVITERNYKGDVLKITRRDEQRDSLNPNLTINNRISVIADAFANENIFAIRYITWMGSKWSITSVEVERPRLLLTIGGVYHGN
jgi:hypothetical protein